ncbi:MAG: ABC transporter permease, partial [Clostridiaceae bacterium]|nr:ABC transporter permease [Clostridiaceae bacterium]
RLAADGIRKNKRLYIPYILTCIGIVMMFYIISFLSTHQLLDVMKVGGRTMKEILHLGWWVIGIFAVMFLFYTYSFLVRRRKKEFGLFNILGMGKRHLARVLFFENLMIAGISILGGLAMGIVFSKIAELAMVNVLRGDVTFGFSVSLPGIRNTVLFFLGIFTLIFLNTLRQISFSKPIELLGSEKTGEKQPKARWIMTILGILLLGFAYVTAVSIKNPITAITWFFVAVIMVIIATYLLFIAASVVLCKVLKNIKGYYYRTNHFVSVSSMAYRMKRNGAGLATICILSTMVLVMISSTLCLNLSMEKSLRSAYPRDILFDVNLGVETKALDGDRQNFVDLLTESASAQGATPQNILNYEKAEFWAALVGDRFNFDVNGFNDFAGSSDIWIISVISLQDYNRLTGSNESLEPEEVLIQTSKDIYTYEQIAFGSNGTFRVKKQVSNSVSNGLAMLEILPSMTIYVSDLKSFIEPIIQRNSEQGLQGVGLHWCYAFDVGGDAALQTRLYETINQKSEKMQPEPDHNWQWFGVEALAVNRAEFNGMYGGMFFLGVLLSIVFVIATVLIIYYKQVSEGYEDRERFDIMQKVGMTRKEIKKAVNSQVLIVFFLPLLTAGLHLAFAFPFVSKFLKLLGVNDVPFLILVTIASFLVFGLFYILVYRVTSRAYFKIVSDGQRE